MSVQCYIFTENEAAIHLADRVGIALAAAGLRCHRVGWHVEPSLEGPTLYTCHVNENGTVAVGLRMGSRTQVPWSRLAGGVGVSWRGLPQGGTDMHYTNMPLDDAIALVTEDFNGTAVGDQTPSEGAEQARRAQQQALNAQQQALNAQKQAEMQLYQAASPPTTVVYNNCTINNYSGSNVGDAPQRSSSKKQRLLSSAQGTGTASSTSMCKQCGDSYRGAHACGGVPISPHVRPKGKRSGNVGQSVKTDGRSSNTGMSVRRTYPAIFKQKMVDLVDGLINEGKSRAEACRLVMLKESGCTVLRSHTPNQVPLSFLSLHSVQCTHEFVSFSLRCLCLRETVKQVLSPVHVHSHPQHTRTFTHAGPLRTHTAFL